MRQEFRGVGSMSQCPDPSRLCGRVTRSHAGGLWVSELQSSGMLTAGTGITLADSFRKG